MAKPAPYSRISPATTGQNSFALWFGVLGGPLAWGAQEVTSYAFSAYACAPHMRVLDEPVLRGLVLLLALIAVAAAAVAVSAGLVALNAWRGSASSSETHHESSHGGDVRHVAHRAGDIAGDQRTGRVRFMALVGISFSTLFLLGILLNAVPLFTLNFCAAR